MSRDRAPRVFWFSNSPAVGTGYGTQTAQVLRRLKRRGHPAAVHANYGQAVGVGKWNGLRVYPQGMDGWSQDVIVDHYRAVEGESSVPLQLVTLCDVWVLAQPRLAELDSIWSWVPIDHAGLPPDVERWLRRPNVLPLAMSKHGSAVLDAAGIDHRYVPHALEKHWRPSVLEADPWPGRFVVTIPNANKGVLPSRKAWGENLLAFAVFARRHPEALLYLHTDARGSGLGIDLPLLVQRCGISPEQVMFVDQYDHRMGVPDELMARIYSRTDVLLSATAGEGFGLPVLEAQACGTRVIVSDFSAQPELVGDGWVAAVQPQWNPTQGHWFATPLVESIVEALELAFASGGGYSQEAVDFAAAYDADRVFAECWVPLLDGAA
jgi:hypothetical protein